MIRSSTTKPEWYDDQARSYLARIRHSLNFWSHGYYVENKSPVVDSLWERYYTDLRKLEDSYPGIVVPYSPTRNVGCACPACKPNLYTADEAATFAKIVKTALLPTD